MSKNTRSRLIVPASEFWQLKKEKKTNGEKVVWINENKGEVFGFCVARRILLCSLFRTEEMECEEK